MPDTSTLGIIAGIILILAILGLIFLRILLVRFLCDLLLTPWGRTVLGILMCIGGINYVFNSTSQNHLLVGAVAVGGGLLLLLITFGIPLLSKHWEDTSTPKAPSPRQTWPTPAPTAPPGIPTIPTSQPAGPWPAPNMPTPQPGYSWPVPNMPTPQPQGYWSPPSMPMPGSGGSFLPSNMPMPGQRGYPPNQYVPPPQPGAALPAPSMPPMANNMPPQSQGNRERSW